jgi:hypothetical protein
MCAYMRTTIEVPDPLMKQARRLAVERGVTLKRIVVEALEREIASAREIAGGPRLRFPLLRSEQPESLMLSGADIESFETDEDAR